MKSTNNIYLLIFLSCINLSITAKSEEHSQNNHPENIYLEEIEKLKEDETLKKRFDREFKYPHIEMVLNLLDIINTKNKNHYEQKVLDNFKKGQLDIDFFYNTFLLNEARAPKLLNLINKLCKKLEIERPLIFWTTDENVESSLAAQTFSGIPHIVLSESFSKQSSTKSFEATLAHELSHIKYNHAYKTALLTFAEKYSTMFIIPPIFASFLILATISQYNTDVDSNNKIAFFNKENLSIFLASTLLLHVYSIIYLLIIKNEEPSFLLKWIGRKMEKNADLKATEILDNPEDAIHLAETCKNYHQGYIDNLNEEHDFIVNKIEEVKINLNLDKEMEPLLEFVNTNKEVLNQMNSTDNNSTDHPSDNKRLEYIKKHIEKLKQQRSKEIKTVPVAV